MAAKAMFVAAQQISVAGAPAFSPNLQIRECQLGCVLPVFVLKFALILLAMNLVDAVGELLRLRASRPP